MQQVDLGALSRRLLDEAGGSSSRRAGSTVYGTHESSLHQTVVALAEGAALAEHESPGDATLLVLSGRVRLVAGDRSWDGETGELLVIPPARHSLEALSDAAVLLTVARR